MSVHLFRAQARNNAWANHRLLSACAALLQQDFEARRASFFPSLKATLNHILIVDWFYVAALEGGEPARSDDETPCATVRDLHREQAAVDRRLIAHCDGLEAANLAATVNLVRADGVRVERRDRVLLHLLQHQIHHRGQAHAMLAGTDVAPPQLDEFFLSQDRDLRAEDFAALGWDEDSLWKGF